MSPPHKGIEFKDLSSVNLCSRLLGITAVLNAVKMNSFGFFFWFVRNVVLKKTAVKTGFKSFIYLNWAIEYNPLR